MTLILDAKRRTKGRRTTYVCHKPPPSTRLPRWIIFSSTAGLLIAMLVQPLARHIFVSGRELPRDAISLGQFQRSLSDIDMQLEAATARYGHLSSDATRHRDLLALFDATNEYEARLDNLSRQVARLRGPETGNARTDAWVLLARDVAVQRITALRTANQLMVEAVNGGQISNVATQAIQRARASAQVKYHEEIGALRRGYEALGLPRDDIPNSLVRG